MVPALIPDTFTLTQTKFPVKLFEKTKVDPSMLSEFIVVPLISK